MKEINDLTPIEISNRVAGYTKLEQEKISELRKSNKQQKEKISKLKKNNKVLSRQIKQSDGFKEQGKNTVLKSLGKTAKRIKKQLQKR